MGILEDIKMYGRFALGLRGYLRHTISLEEAQAIVKQRMEERETNFIRLVKKGIFGYRGSPYLPLLKLAGCELGDIEDMVQRRGLEKTLLVLREAGVYVRFEEFKGREPIQRNGQIIPVKAHSFDNPFLSHYYQSETGGTTGAGTRIDMDLDHLAALTPNSILNRAAHGVLNVPTAIWFGVLPDGTGIAIMLIFARSGYLPQKWFSPVMSQDLRPILKYRLANQYLITVGRWFGVPIPEPEPTPLDQAVVIARWAAKTLEVQSACLIHAGVSKAVRICIAAQEEGLNLTGTTFIGGGEPPTSAKLQNIKRVGARFVPNYYFDELGAIGMGCAQPVDENDLHLLKDSVAMIQFPREVKGSGVNVDSFHFTTLLPSAPKMMLNVESDDYGVIETRFCGCPWESYGFIQHIRHVRSFSKLTGEGVTLVGSEMTRILEEVLPARFGGSPLDYQLLEEEDEKGFTRLTLLISPKVGIPDENAVIQTVFDALRKSSAAADLAQTIWSQAKTIRVRHIEPIWTARGKLMPLHLPQRSGNR